MLQEKFKTIRNVYFEAVIKVNVNFVKKTLDKIKDKTVGQNLGNSEIVDILDRAFFRHSVIFEMGFGSSSNTDYQDVALIGGSIANDLETITITYEMDYFWQVFEDGSYWKKFVVVVTQIIKHELIHREQFKRIKNIDVVQVKNLNPNNTEEYLSDKQEIMSFAQSAVDQFLSLGYTKNDVLKRVRKPFDKSLNPGRNESDVFWMYTEYFGAGDVVLKRFLKYMFGYL